MAVSVYHRSKSGGFRLQIKLFEDVQDIDRNACDFENIRLRNLPRPGPVIYVAAHGGNRRDLRQFRKDCRIPDIAGVNDRAGSAQCLDCFRTQQSMGVGDNADDHSREIVTNRSRLTTAAPNHVTANLVPAPDHTESNRWKNVR